VSESLKEARSLVEDVGGVQYDGAFSWIVIDGGRATSLMGTLVSGEFFRVLGARPALALRAE
jgi:hypothetical protein